jgi:hypothetical protein
MLFFLPVYLKAGTAAQTALDREPDWLGSSLQPLQIIQNGHMLLKILPYPWSMVQLCGHSQSLPFFFTIWCRNVSMEREKQDKSFLKLW